LVEDLPPKGWQENSQSNINQQAEHEERAKGAVVAEGFRAGRESQT